MAKLNLSAVITPIFSVLQKCWKQLLLYTFVDTDTFFRMFWWVQKNSIDLKSKLFCNSLKVFTVTFEKVLCCQPYRVFLLLNSSLLSDLVFIPGGKVKKPTFPQESSERWIWHKMTSHFICLSIRNSSVCSNQKAGCTILWDSFWNLSAWDFLKMTCTHSTSYLWPASENLCKNGLCLCECVKTDTMMKKQTLLIVTAGSFTTKFMQISISLHVQCKQAFSAWRQRKKHTSMGKDPLLSPPQQTVILRTVACHSLLSSHHKEEVHKYRR